MPTSTSPVTTGFQHVALNVTDLDEALRFYLETMGFEINPARPDFGFPGAWLFVGAHQLHLMEAPGVEPDRRQHFALNVEDVDAWETHLSARGVKTFRLPEVPGAGRQIFIIDPSGNRIELNEPGH